MKKTGIIRRLDNLGRIVIPHELRMTYNISEHDPLEIFVSEDGSIVLRKYQINDQLTESVSAMRNTVEQYGDRLPKHVSVALKKHTFEMLKLLEEEQKK